MKTTKISIVTACRNAEAHIEQTIKSVLDQNYADLEYIIIDGKSSDRTLEIVSRYQSRIDRMVSEPDDGISDAFNKGIHLATGDVIGIVSADDYLLPGALDSVASGWHAGDCPDVVHGNILFLDTLSGAPTFVRPDPGFGKIWSRQPLKHASVFVRKSTYEKFGMFSKEWHYAMDYDLILRFYLGGCRFHYLDRALAAVRPGGRSSSIKRTMWETCRIAEHHGRAPWKARVNFCWKWARCHVRSLALRPMFRGPLRIYRSLNPRFTSREGSSRPADNKT